MLRLMLNSHPGIAIPHEFPLLEVTKNWIGEKPLSKKGIPRFVDHLYSHPHFQDWDLDRLDLSSQLREICPACLPEVANEIYNLFAKTNSPSAKHWGEKNIGSASLIADIYRWYPDVRFIHLIRDGRDVAASLLERKWRFYQFSGRRPHYIKHIIGTARTWNDGIDLIQRQLGTIPKVNFMEVQYEALIVDPELHCQEICRFLALNFHDDMLNFHIKNLEEKMIPRERLKRNHENTTKPVMATNSGKYHRELTINQIAIFQDIAGPALAKSNYELDPVKLNLFHWLIAHLAYKAKFLFFGFLMNLKSAIRHFTRSR